MIRSAIISSVTTFCWNWDVIGGGGYRKAGMMVKWGSHFPGYLGPPKVSEMKVILEQASMQVLKEHLGVACCRQFVAVFSWLENCWNRYRWGTKGKVTVLKEKLHIWNFRPMVLVVGWKRQGERKCNSILSNRQVGKLKLLIDNTYLESIWSVRVGSMSTPWSLWEFF